MFSILYVYSLIGNSQLTYNNNLKTKTLEWGRGRKAILCQVAPAVPFVKKICFLRCGFECKRQKAFQSN